MFKKSIVFALFAVASAAHAVTLYNNTDPNGTVFTAANRNYVADDFRFSDNGTGNGVNIAATVTGLELGYYYNSATITGFDILVNVYKDFNLTDTDANTHELTNLAYTHTFSIPAANTVTGANTTGLLSTGGFNLGTISNFATSSHGIEVKFLNSGTSTPNTDVFALFKGDIPPTVGTSADVYYRDANGNGFIDGSDARNFGGGITRANLYMRFEGQPVPEPSTVAALALGGLAVLRRRKRS